ncbi:MAG: DNA methyltransferase [Clostridiales bacterium]|nr:DNA methyltransferase [Clostridiales bacterium]
MIYRNSIITLDNLIDRGVKYNIIYADPPWNYKDQACNGGVGKHYRCMSVSEICKLPIQNITADNAFLFLWVTYPFLQEGLAVIENWGFECKSIAFQWIKLNRKNNNYFFGLGRWTRGNTEPCLLGIKGKPQRVDNSVSQIIEAPVAKHSRKPMEARRKIIQLVGDLPRIELFARNRIRGWDAWGDEL